MTTETYLGKERFQSENEARDRRISLGRAAQERTEWALERVRARITDGYTLDLACGNGRHTQALSNGKNKVLAADISEPMLRKAKELVQGNTVSGFVRLEAEHLPFPDDSIEVVFSFRFLHHIPTAEIRRNILQEMVRVSRKGVILTIKARFTPEHLTTRIKDLIRGKWRHPHRYFVSESEIEKAVESQGWRITESLSNWGPLTATRVLVLDPVK